MAKNVFSIVGTISTDPILESDLHDRTKSEANELLNGLRLSGCGKSAGDRTNSSIEDVDDPDRIRAKIPDSTVGDDGGGGGGNILEVTGNDVDGGGGGGMKLGTAGLVTGGNEDGCLKEPVCEIGESRVNQGADSRRLRLILIGSEAAGRKLASSETSKISAHR